MKKDSIGFLLLLMTLNRLPVHGAAGGRFAVMTFVSNEEQARTVRAQIKSIREFGGPYKNSRIYVVLTDRDNLPGGALKGANVELLDIEMDKAFIDYPLAAKAFAAAQVETLVANEVGTLVWLDPSVIVMDSLDDLDLAGGRHDVAARPVYLLNTIGIPSGTEPNDYWAPIYRAAGLDYRKLAAYKTVVDEGDIQPYFNCEVIAYNPKLGICREWARIFEPLLKDKAYQSSSCTTFQRRLFLHQAALSGVIASKVSPDRIKPLPLACGYPFIVHEKMPPAKKASTMKGMSVVIFDDAWANDPAWMKKIPIPEPLNEWLSQAYLEYLELAKGLYRVEGSCNSYLIRTKTGSVLIDPAGAASAPEFFSRILAESPIEAILLTHAHRDHSGGLEEWRRGRDVPVIAQREYPAFFEYEEEFAGLFARRNAIWAGRPIPSGPPAPASPHSKPTILFADDHEFASGGVRFRMIHVSGETPDHSIIWIPEKRAVCVGDDYYEYFINNSTFRGTMVRPIKGYIRALDTALSLEPELFLPGHGAPVLGRGNIEITVGKFRDALKHIYAETVKGINEGKDVYALMRDVKLPADCGIGQYYGKTEWTVRGIYQEYVGWFDEDPATMYAEPVSDLYPDLAELAGPGALVKRAEDYLARGDYVKALHLTEIVLKSNPSDPAAGAARIKALKSLKAGTNNYIERIWLDHAIRLGERTPGKAE